MTFKIKTCHIIDLQQTASFLYRALQAIQDVAKRQGKILFVGTKRQASEHIKEAAKRCGTITKYYWSSYQIL